MIYFTLYCSHLAERASLKDSHLSSVPNISRSNMSQIWVEIKSILSRNLTYLAVIGRAQLSISRLNYLALKIWVKDNPLFSKI